MVDPAATRDPRIDAGLDSYPLSPLPDGFLARAMTRIAAEDAIAARVGSEVAATARIADPVAATALTVPSPTSDPISTPRHGLRRIAIDILRLALDTRWPVLDLALPVFLIVLAGAVVAVSVWSLNAADPLWLARASLRARMAWHAADVGLPRLGLGYGAVLAGSLAFGALATVVAMIGAAALPAMGVSARKAGGGLIARPVR